MGYASWLEGSLRLRPALDPVDAPRVRAALEAGATPAAGRIELSTDGTTLELRDAVDWQQAVDALERARATLLREAGLAVDGELRARGEDDAELATVRVDELGVHVTESPSTGALQLADWLSALGSGNAELREAAASALADSSGAPVRRSLSQVAARDSSERVRCRALESLGEIGHDAASELDTLRTCLADPSPTVRYWATYALGRVGPAALALMPELEKVAQESADGPRYGALDAIRRLRAG